MRPLIRAWWMAVLVASGTAASAQIVAVDCATNAATCLAGCARLLLGSGLAAAAQCRERCSGDQRGCERRASAQPAAPAVASTVSAADAELALGGVTLGAHKLSLVPLLESKDLRPFLVPALDGVPLLVFGYWDAPAPPPVEPLRRFVEAYAARRHDWTVAPQHWRGAEAGAAGDGASLIGLYLQAAALLQHDNDMTGALREGMNSPLVLAFTTTFLKPYLPCIDDRSSPDCERVHSGRERERQWKGSNEFERERSREAFVAAARAALRAALPPGSRLQLVVYEQRRVLEYDMQQERFPTGGYLRHSVFHQGNNLDAPVTLGRAGAFRLDRPAPADWKVGKAQAEALVGTLDKHQAPGAKHRSAYLLARLDCALPQGRAERVPDCRVKSAVLHADPLLQVPVGAL